jgi:hypothetical protein
MERLKPDCQSLLILFDQEMRQGITYPDLRKEILPWGVRFIRPAPGMSFIRYFSPDKNNADATIQEQLDYFKTNNEPFSWTVFEHDAPRDMKERLVNYGFEPDEPGAVMLLDVSKASPILLEPSEVDIRQITHRSELGDVIKILEQVWGGNFEWIWERLGNHLAIPGYLSIYVAYIENAPASVGWIYYHTRSQFASLFGGSTVVGLRGRGLYTALLACRVQEARQRRVRYLTVETSPMSQPIVASHGFWQLSTAQDFIAPPQSPSQTET